MVGHQLWVYVGLGAFVWLLWPRLGAVRPPAGEEAAPLIVDGLLLAVFGLHHSLFARVAVKDRLDRRLGKGWERPIYVAISSALLIVLAINWQCTERMLYSLGQGWVWPVRALFVAVVVFQIRADQMMPRVDSTGLRHLRAALTGQEVLEPALVERGVYRVIRHPQYAATIVLVWCAPAMTADRLLLAVVLTVWMVAAALLEERNLVRRFGQSYRDYQKRAGFLWPKLGKAAS